MFPLKLPRTWQKGGYYPTEYCVHASRDDDIVAVTLERLVLRESSGP